MLFSKGVRKHCYKRAYHARARGRDMYAGGARGARVFIKLAKKREMRKGEKRKTRVANVWATGRASVRVARESKRNDWRQSCESARGEMVET